MDDGIRPLMEDNLWWKRNFDERWPSMEDDLQLKTTLNGRQPLTEDKDCVMTKLRSTKCYAPKTLYSYFNWLPLSCYLFVKPTWYITWYNGSYLLTCHYLTIASCIMLYLSQYPQDWWASPWHQSPHTPTLSSGCVALVDLLVMNILARAVALIFCGNNWQSWK